MPQREPSDQERAFAFLGHGKAYGLPDQAVERIETHAAYVFLVGERAYKMKRAVRYSFFDFSTLEQRRAVLEAELRLNRRTAPQLYHRVLPLTANGDGELALDGQGRPIEWLLEMTRFDQAALLDNLAGRHGLDERLIERLAGEIARFHAQAEVRVDHGGHAGMAAVIDGNASDLCSLAPELLPAITVEALNRASREELERRREPLDERRRAGCVRHCHGDLHLGNIVLLDDRPVLFDCLEFDEALACTDSLYDLAFLLMDLSNRGLRPEAQRLLSHYLELHPDDSGLAVLPLFQSCRAAVRAKTGGFSARLAKEDHARSQAVGAARRYLRLAHGLLRPVPARLIAVGGLSGTGKSTLARALAAEIGAAPGAVLLRSDRLRKRLHGLEPEDRLPPEGYGAEITARVYAQIADRAEAILRAGHSVVADAVFADPAERAAIETVARRTGASFTGLWLEAPAADLERRIEARRGDASDATVEVLRRQQDFDLGEIAWVRIDAAGEPAAIAARARRALASRPVRAQEDDCLADAPQLQ